MMRFVRKWYWLLYPSVGALLGGIVMWDIDVQTGLIGGGLLGFGQAFWYSLRRLRYPPY